MVIPDTITTMMVIVPRHDSGYQDYHRPTTMTYNVTISMMAIINYRYLKYNKARSLLGGIPVVVEWHEGVGLQAHWAASEGLGALVHVTALHADPDGLGVLELVQTFLVLKAAEEVLETSGVLGLDDGDVLEAGSDGWEALLLGDLGELRISDLGLLGFTGDGHLQILD